MDVGLVGLGKMGWHLGLNMLDHNHRVTAFDTNAETARQMEQNGALAAASLPELVDHLPTPRIIWLMVPAGEVTDQVINELAPLLAEEDIVIDGGNSHYKATLKHYEQLSAQHIHFFDAGTSGGVSGARQGACFMIGGEPEIFPQIEPLIGDLALADGYYFSGQPGGGHFLKMIHNGIEYGMMQAIGEGFDLLEKSPFDYDYEKVANVWNHGSVIRGWLMELAEQSFSADPQLEKIRGVMHSSGEGKWTVESALDFETAAPVIALSLMMRYRSQEADTFNGKVVAALRHGFGGHDVEQNENGGES